MPFAVNRGQKIHYTVEGSGELVVLQHGLFSRGSRWKDHGVVEALTDRFRVACIDSLGHGFSDKPADPALYAQVARAEDIAAVIDHLGSAQAHVVGYSMGGWIAVGVAKHLSERLLSLTIGGWDFVNGVKTAIPGAPVSFEQMFGGARARAPELFEWVTREVEPSLAACWSALDQLEGASEAVLGAGCPVLIWDGREDPYHGPMQAFATTHRLRFLSTPGDHLTALTIHGAEGARGVRAFLDCV
jgi:pimeloyl-ACP methyl ester carboxylesterase